MHLFITSDQKNVEIAGIDLVDGYLPSISKLTTTLIRDECRIQPAIWFKVMVVDTLSIDCNTKVISWNCISTDTPHSTLSSVTPPITPPLTSHTTNDDDLFTLPLTPPSTPPSPLPPAIRYKHSISAEEINFAGAEDTRYGSSDLNEVFEEVPYLVLRYHRNKITPQEFHSNIKRLLHLYVLPCICLTVANIGAVRKCLEVQQSHIGRIEDEIVKETNARAKIKTDKREKRQTFIDELSVPGCSPKYTFAFANILMDDIEKDVKKYTENIDSFQKVVDRMKETLSEMDETNDLYESTAAMLEDCRTQRLSLVDQHRDCLLARDALRYVIKLLYDEQSSAIRRFTLRLRRDSVDDPAQLYYISQHDAETRVLSVIDELNNRKLLATSVKESIRTSLKDLENGRETCGVDVSATGAQNATDVLGGGGGGGDGIVPRSWQTLEQQVGSIISEDNNSIATESVVMCMRVLARSTAATYEKKNFDQGLHVLIRKKSVKNYSSSLSSLKSSRSKISFPPSANNGSWPQMSTSKASLPHIATLSDHLAISNIRYRTSYTESIESEYWDDTEMLQHDQWLLEQIRKKNYHEEIDRQVCRQPCVPYYFKQSALDGGREMTLCFLHDVITHVHNSRFVLENVPNSGGNASNRAGPSASGEISNTRKHRREADAFSESPVAKFASVTYRSFTTESPEDDAIAVLDEDRDYMKTAIEALRDEIKAHFEKTVGAMQSELKKSGQRVRDKMWLAYEPHFYHSTMSFVVEMYFAEYGRAVEKLVHLVDGLTTSDLSFDEAKLARMLQDVRTNRSANVNIPTRSRTHGGNGKAICSERFNCDDDDASSMDWFGSTSDVGKCTSKIIDEQEIEKYNIEREVSGDSVKELQCRLSDANQSRLDLSCEVKVAKTMILKPRYRSMYAAACNCFMGVINARTPAGKLQYLYDGVADVLKQIDVFNDEMPKRGFEAAGTDDLMDALVILVCNFEDLPNLYTQIKLLGDLKPSFYEHNKFAFSLVQLCGACTFVIDHLEQKSARLDSESIVRAEQSMMA